MRSLLLWVVLVAACSPARQLLVDLTTDYCPEGIGAECRQDRFDAVRVALDRGVEQTRAVRPGDVYEPPSAVRVAELLDLPPGTLWVTVELLRDGVVVASRRQPVQVQGARQITIAITVSCRGVTCPPATDPAATECVSGVCVAPECFDMPGSCGPLCQADVDCTAPFECVRMRCVSGACLAVPDATLCAPGERCLLDRGCFGGVLEGDPCQTSDDCGATELICCGNQCHQPDCNDNNSCTDDACTRDGCENTPLEGACDDGVFCNGVDTCGAGACGVHAGSPCGGATAVCDELGDTCSMCATDADCPAQRERGMGCMGLVDTCDEDGAETVQITSYRCADRACVADTRSEVRGCTRDRTGVGCDQGTATCLAGACRCGGGACGPSQYCFADACWDLPRFEVYGQPTESCIDAARGPDPGLLLGYRIYGRPGASFEKFNLHASCPGSAWGRAETGTIPAGGVYDLMLDSPTPLPCGDLMLGRYQQYAVLDGIQTNQLEQVIYNTNGCGAAVASCAAASSYCP